MEIINLYKCECCGFETKDFALAESHEAAHYGLSVKEKHTYDALKSSLHFADHMVKNCINDEQHKKDLQIYYDNTLEKITNFERNHGLIRGHVKYPKVSLPSAAVGHDLI